MNVPMQNFNMVNTNQILSSIKCPFKCIITNSNINGINESSFINAALQSFACLKYINQWIKNLYPNINQINSDINKIITKEIYNLFSALYSGQIPDSSNLIFQYMNKSKLKKQDPYHFLFYLIDLLHQENNVISNINYDYTKLSSQSIDSKKNKDFMRNLFKEFFQQTQNSIFSNYFFNIIRNQYSCENCQDIFFYCYKFIIKFKMDDYIKARDEAHPDKANTNLTLEECFECYTGGYIEQCNNCGNFKGNRYMSFYNPAKILIIALIRKNHIFKCDLEFKNKFNLNDFNETGIYTNKDYYLKACVSLNSQGIYFSDICINNYWFRFCLQQIALLGNVNDDIHTFEPQLLFYEMEE